MRNDPARNIDTQTNTHTHTETGSKMFTSTVHKIDLLPVKFNAVGLEDSFAESILCKSGTNSDGIEEKASLDK